MYIQRGFVQPPRLGVFEEDAASRHVAVPIVQRNFTAWCLSIVCVCMCWSRGHYREFLQRRGVHESGHRREFLTHRSGIANKNVENGDDVQEATTMNFRR